MRLPPFRAAQRRLGPSSAPSRCACGGVRPGPSLPRAAGRARRCPFPRGSSRPGLRRLLAGGGGQLGVAGVAGLGVSARRRRQVGVRASERLSRSSLVHASPRTQWALSRGKVSSGVSYPKFPNCVTRRRGPELTKTLSLCRWLSGYRDPRWGQYPMWPCRRYDFFLSTYAPMCSI